MPFKDECGVFGIFGHPEAANLTYLGLYALQHRGQESAGIAAADGVKLRVSRAMGQVAEAFNEDTLETLPGHIAIGHTRYSTAGESKLENAQPFLIDCSHGQIAVGHNGNLVNALELRDELVQNGSIFQTSSDTEVILHLYARSKAASVEEAIAESIAQIRGAYSLALLTKNRLIAARDPHGFRPLALGRLGDAWIVCSETCALDLIGAQYVRDVEPGELLVISDGGLRSIRPFPPQPLSHCVFEHVYFARPDSYVFGRSVNEVRTDMGRILAQGATAAPVSTKFFQSVAEQMVLVDANLFAGKYAEALTTAFVRRGLMTVRSLAAPEAVASTPARAAAAAARFSAAAAGRAPRVAATDKPVEVAIDGAAVGLSVKTLYVNAPPVDDISAPAGSMMAGVAARETLVIPRVTDVQAFVEALIVRGRVALPAEAGRRRGLVASLSKARKHATHYLSTRADESLELRRIAFECC